MAWPTDHKEKSRQQILVSAAKLFTSKGFANVSLTDVMQDAGMTHGAFYAHFASKADLYCEALVTAGQLSAEGHGVLAGDLRASVHSYLSLAHRCGDKPACPLACLVTDVASKDAQVQATYSQVFQGFVRLLGSTATGVTTRQPAALAALMVGGMAVARTLPDTEAAEQLLADCRAAAELLLVEPQ